MWAVSSTSRSPSRCAGASSPTRRLVARPTLTITHARYELDIKADGTWETETTDGYQRHQREVGNKPEFLDGIPGSLDLGALGAGRFVAVD